MQIIPVIDLKNGRVVRGIAGQREEYRPIESQIAKSASPADVAAAFRRLSFRIVYVADLDAIAGAPPDEQSYAQIAATGLRLWIDAGTSDIVRAETLAKLPYCEAMVIGLESLASRENLTAILRALGEDRAVFSLDLRDGSPPTSIDAWRDAEPLAIVADVVALGISRLIVLDLAAVGTSQGPVNLTLLQSISRRHPQVRLIGGGGVRGPDDLDALASSGSHAALVASALHDGLLG